MKKYYYILLMLIVGGIWACSYKEEPTGGRDEENKTYRISLGMTGEILRVGESPLLKSPENHLYGIQIYSKPSGSTGNYTPYGYGLFDDRSRMEVVVTGGKVYKFQVTMVVDGKDKVYKAGSMGYRLPFAMNGTMSINPDNTVVYSETNSLPGLISGSTQMSDGTFQRPQTDRYYGEVSDYVPTEGGNVQIDMKRVVFGVGFNFAAFSEGTITVKIQDSPDIVITSGNTSGIEKIITFSDVRSAWLTNGYSEILPVSITWKKADNSTRQIAADQSVTFKRNTLHTFHIDLLGETNNGMILQMENGVWEREVEVAF